MFDVRIRVGQVRLDHCGHRFSAEASRQRQQREMVAGGGVDRGHDQLGALCRLGNLLQDADNGPFGCFPLRARLRRQDAFDQSAEVARGGQRRDRLHRAAANRRVGILRFFQQHGDRSRGAPRRDDGDVFGPPPRVFLGAERREDRGVDILARQRDDALPGGIGGGTALGREGQQLRQCRAVAYRAEGADRGEPHFVAGAGQAFQGYFDQLAVAADADGG